MNNKTSKLIKISLLSAIALILMYFDFPVIPIFPWLKIDLSELDLETRFVEDLGADSLDMYQIAMNLEETFDVSFNETDLKQVVTVNDAYELLKSFKE